MVRRSRSRKSLIYRVKFRTSCVCMKTVGNDIVIHMSEQYYTFFWYNVYTRFQLWHGHFKSVTSTPDFRYLTFYNVIWRREIFSDNFNKLYMDNDIKTGVIDFKINRKSMDQYFIRKLYLFYKISLLRLLYQT